MEEKKESISKSFVTGIITGLFSFLPTGSFGAVYTTGFLSNSLTKKPKVRWIWCALVSIIGLFLGTWARILRGVNYLENNFPLPSYILFLMISIGFSLPIIIREYKFKSLSLLEKILNPILFIVGIGVSFCLSYFITEDRESQLISNEYLSMLVLGFILGFLMLIPGLPISPITKLLGMNTYLEELIMNIPNRTEIGRTLGLMFISLIGLLLNFIIFYYPYKLLFKKIKNVIGGLFSGLILGSGIGAFVVHGEFIQPEYPPSHFDDIQLYALIGFIIAGLVFITICILAFSNIIYKKDTRQDKDPLYDQTGKPKKKGFLFFRKRS